MKYRLILIIFFTVLINYTFANGDEILTIKKNIPVFSSITIYEDYVIITTNWSIGKINKKGPDEVKDWKKFESYRIGDIVRATTGQSNEYWEILDIKENKIKLHYYGYLKGLGKFDEIFWVLEYSKKDST
ncbi:MAG: hypothetical protein GTO02_09370 [Candidatus Dadabacteria bacterium]|nr:hypothetical protein [Candidatus Dadabacteria bacterium]NIQ14590.1 hypothetical protein [Candidatus Dadabacteria bacterium]